MNRLLWRLAIAAIAGALAWLTTDLWAGVQVAVIIIVVVYGMEVWDARKADLSPGIRRAISSLAVLLLVAVLVDIVVTNLI
jgi:hypothetical protein